MPQGSGGAKPAAAAQSVSPEVTGEYSHSLRKPSVKLHKAVNYGPRDLGEYRQLAFGVRSLQTFRRTVGVPIVPLAIPRDPKREPAEPG
jgi:hypothetical protein